MKKYRVLPLLLLFTLSLAPAAAVTTVPNQEDLNLF